MTGSAISKGCWRDYRRGGTSERNEKRQNVPDKPIYNSLHHNKCQNRTKPVKLRFSKKVNKHRAQTKGSKHFGALASAALTLKITMTVISSELRLWRRQYLCPAVALSRFVVWKYRVCCCQRETYKKKVHHVLVSNDGLFGSRTNKTHSLEIYGQISNKKKTDRVRLCQQQLKVLNL